MCENSIVFTNGSTGLEDSLHRACLIHWGRHIELQEQNRTYALKHAYRWDPPTHMCPMVEVAIGLDCLYVFVRGTPKGS